jgi:ActR/RegA family two-component response regulator
MKKSIRLLIVEDDLNQTQSWGLQIEAHNTQASETGSFTLEHEFAKTKEEAISLISKSNFDAAIVDLGLALKEGHKQENANGNEVVAALEKAELAVIIIYTGQPQLAKEAGERGPNVEVITKGDDSAKLVMEILSGSAAMLLTVREAEETIRGEMASMFSKSIWPRWKFWLNGKPNPDSEITAAVSRHLVSHVYAALLEKGGHKALPEEWYFVPPVRDGLRTGDIVEMPNSGETKKEFAVVITPRCDLANNEGNKNETYQLAICSDVSDDWNSRKKALTDLLDTVLAKPVTEDAQNKHDEKIKRAHDKVRRLTQHSNNTICCHFLHQMQTTDGTKHGPFLVRFDQITSIQRDSEMGERIKKANRVAAITPEFLPSLVERLGAYFSRIGSPDYSFTEDSN